MAPEGCSAAAVVNNLSPEGLEGEHEQHGDGGHHHHEKPQSLISAVVSGAINYLLMFGLCCAYGMIMFDERHAQHRALGVKMNLFAAAFMGLLLALRSGVRVAIGGPDLNPVVFLGAFVAKIGQDIARQLDLEHSDAASGARRLGAAAAPASDWACSGEGLAANLELCAEYHEQLRATAIFAVAVSSAALGLLFFLSGHFRITRYASYVPTCVMEAFMSCVGYKVFKYALHFCEYDAQQFVPAACVGVPLYFMKAYHVGNPAVVIPLMLLIPLAIFYAAVFGTGSDLNEVDEWMFPKMENVPFWQVWEDSVGNYSKINFKAWSKTLPDLCVMLVVCFMDCLLKLLGTEGKLPVKVDKDREMQLFGLGNVITAMSGSSVGYMQLKFNVINFGILGNTSDRRGAVVYALLCAATWLSTIEHFNFLPRFFLATLLFFAGAGFVAENLWGSRKFLSLREWMQILLILAVFIIGKDLLYAVIVGVILTCADFIITYAKVPCVVRPPQRSTTEITCVRRSPLLQGMLKHLLSNWLLVVRLKGFIFFASAQILVAQIRDMMEEEGRNNVPQHRRLHFIVFDCQLMDGMDASTAKVLRKLTSDARSLKVSILWTNVKDGMEERLRTQELVTGESQIYAELDQALCCIEDYILHTREQLQANWVSLHPAFEAEQRLTAARTAFEPFKDVFLEDSARQGCPWRFCTGVQMKQGSVLWTPGSRKVPLFLVHSGAVALFCEPPGADVPASAWPSPVVVYRQGWFLNCESLICQPARYHAVALEDVELVSWSREQWWQMDREYPRMASAISHAMMKQQACESQRADPTRGGHSVDLPEDVRARVRNMRLAHELGKMKWYDAPDVDHADTYLPPLPAYLLRDLMHAFCVFAAAGDSTGAEQRTPGRQLSLAQLTRSDTKGGSSAELLHAAAPEAVLQPDNLQDALMFAGIFSTGSVANCGKASGQPLSFDEFVRLAHESAMIRLTSSRVQELTETFRRHDKGNSGTLDCLELAEALSSAFGRKLDNEALESLVSEWTACAAAMDEGTFVALAARFARLREPDWHLYNGLRDFAGGEDGTNEGNSQAQLTLEKLLARAPHLAAETAEEMLWMADWRSSGKGDGRALDVCDVLCAVLLPAWRPLGRLPLQGLEREVDRVRHIGKGGSSLGSCSTLGLAEGASCGRAKSHGSLPAWGSAPGEEGGATVIAIAGEEPEEKQHTLRQRLHLLLEDPGSSRAAQVLWTIMGVFILVSVFTMVAQPLISPGKMSTSEKEVWFDLECFFTVVFTVEYLLRLSVASAFGTSTAFSFVISPANLCDLVAILPFYIEVAIKHGGGGEGDAGFRLLRIVRLLRLSRITRIARLAKRNPLFGPVAMVLCVIWFIYLKTSH